MTEPKRDWVGAIAAVSVVLIGTGVLIWILTGNRIPGVTHPPARHHPTPAFTPVPSPGVTPRLNMPPASPGPATIVVVPTPAPQPTRSPAPRPTRTPTRPPATQSPTPKPIVCATAPLLDLCVHHL